MKKRFFLLLIGITILLSIIWFGDFKEVLTGIFSFGLVHVIVLCFMQIFTLMLINLQWILLLRDMGISIKLIDIIDMNMTGTFFECITPAVKVGGEAAKVIFLKNKAGISSNKATAAVTIQKMLSMLCFLFLLMISIFTFFLTVTISNTDQLMLLFIFSIFVLIIALPFLLLYWINNIPSNQIRNNWIKIFKDKVDHFIICFKSTFSSILKNKFSLILHICLSLLIWIFFAIKTYYILYVLQIDLRFSSAAIITYLTYMIGMLPLLPGGLGSFEAGMILLLTPMGVSNTVGIIVAFLLRFITYWFVFLLSCIYLGCKTLCSMKERKIKYDYKKVSP